MVQTSARPTARPSARLPCHSVTIVPAIRPIRMPMLSPMPVSLRKCLKNFLGWIWPSAMPRENTVELWVPTLPPISMMSGMKMATTAMDSSVSSKPSITMPARKPATSVMRRKGRRTLQIFQILPWISVSLRLLSLPVISARPA